MYIPTFRQSQLINLQSKLSLIFGVLPFIWDNKLMKYKFDLKVFKYSLYTTIPLCTLQYLFVIEETFRHVFFSKRKQLSGSLIYCLVWIILFAYQHINLYLIFCKSNQYIALLNSFKSYTQYIAGNQN